MICWTFGACDSITEAEHSPTLRAKKTVESKVYALFQTTLLLRPGRFSKTKLLHTNQSSCNQFVHDKLHDKYDVKTKILDSERLLKITQ